MVLGAFFSEWDMLGSFIKFLSVGCEKAAKKNAIKIAHKR